MRRVSRPTSISTTSSASAGALVWARSSPAAALPPAELTAVLDEAAPDSLDLDGASVIRLLRERAGAPRRRGARRTIRPSDVSTSSGGGGARPDGRHN